MDDLRWILATVGAVVVVSIYLSGRFEREEWKRDRAVALKPSQPVIPERVEPRIETQIEVQDEVQIKAKIEPQVEPQSGDQRDDGADQIPEHKKPVSHQAFSGLNSEAYVKRALVEDESEPSSSEKEVAKNKEEESSGEWESVVDSTQESLIEDEIVAVEIPSELAEFGEERRSESRLKLKPEIEEPVQQELVLDVEPLVLVLTVLAKDGNQFSGADIKNALEAERLKHGDMDIFHFHMTGKKDSVFSVASVVEPGVFDLSTIEDYETPGLSLFCQLPNPMAGAGAFDVLLKKARSIADKLNGQLCDDKRNLLTEQAIGHYRDRITAFNHEMVLARKKQE